ncbi:hypothetical protein [Aquibacillus salsiterrae]|uniref:Uncharacterized protein n=1 Tax=Aquibacillus salsiterrae TaxID=2950439 RepID=A0A9X4AEM1_9BACI|nr:hypothetical protein [Aquibacillus salsiterrae]MDC3417082.1 hypothetical protein [Aquibacillus salsiterrae]
MKNILSLTLLLFIIFLSGCKDDEDLVDTSSPLLTASKMNFLSDDLFYADFKKLFVDSSDDEFIKKKYELVRQISDSKDSTISTLALIQYENNKTLLLQLKHDTDTDKYLIRNVIELPEEIASFFEEEL